MGNSSAALFSTRSACCRRRRRRAPFSPTPRRTSATTSSRRCSSRPEFTDYWSYKWSDLLLVTKRKLQARGDVGLLQMDPRSGRLEHAVGRVRAPSAHRPGQHAGKRRGQLFRDPSRPARSRRDDVADLPRHLDELREVPQPPDGEVDEQRLLRLRQSLRPRAAEKRCAGRRKHRLRRR